MKRIITIEESKYFKVIAEISKRGFKNFKLYKNIFCMSIDLTDKEKEELLKIDGILAIEDNNTFQLDLPN